MLCLSSMALGVQKLYLSKVRICSMIQLIRLITEMDKLVSNNYNKLRKRFLSLQMGNQAILHRIPIVKILIQKQSKNLTKINYSKYLKNHNFMNYETVWNKQNVCLILYILKFIIYLKQIYSYLIIQFFVAKRLQFPIKLQPYMQKRIKTLSQNKTQKTTTTIIKRSPSRFTSLQEERGLKQKASQFIFKLRNQKKQLEGKLSMKKWQQKKRKQQEQKKIQIQQQLKRQLQREVRRMKAEINIQYYKQKHSIFQNRSRSSRIKTLSQNSESSLGQSLQRQRQRLPSIYESDLQQIRQEDNQSIPVGLKKVNKKQVTRRSKTQTNHHNLSCKNISPQTEQLKNVNTGERKLFKYRTKQKSRKQSDYNKKSYLIKKNNSQDISEYIQNFTNLNHFIDLNKIKQEKKLKIKNRFKIKNTPRIPSRNLETNELSKQQKQFQQFQDEEVLL